MVVYDKPIDRPLRIEYFSCRVLELIYSWLPFIIWYMSIAMRSLSYYYYGLLYLTPIGYQKLVIKCTVCTAKENGTAGDIHIKVKMEKTIMIILLYVLLERKTAKPKKVLLKQKMKRKV